MEDFKDPRTFQSRRELDWLEARRASLSKVSSRNVADSPILYCDRRLMAQIVAKIKIFELSKNIQGSVIECGVHRGNSLMLFMHLCSIFSPVAFNKKIIGFDTFRGFASVSEHDPDGINVGDLDDVDFVHLSQWIKLQQENNVIPQVSRVELVRGIAEETIPHYVNDNPHLLVSLLYLDFDLYSPTLTALRNLYPLMPKGAVIAFDQLNQEKWAGETKAFKEFFKINDLKIKVFDFEPHISYAVVGE